MTARGNIYCLQHILPSFVAMSDALSRFYDDRDIWIVGKQYSTIQKSLQKIVNEGSGNIRVRQSLSNIPLNEATGRTILLDEGGGLQDRLSVRGVGSVAGVEQTTAGMRATWKYPTVLVCRSAAKLLFESQVIARGLIRKLESLGLMDGRPIGVIGLGALGGEITRRLAEKGCSVIAYDVTYPRGGLAAFYRPLDELLASSALVLGATGRDCLSGVTLGAFMRSVTFASCSSGNIEFASILRQLTSRGDFGLATGTIGMASVSVLNGGYPVNFDRTIEWETADEMWLTRQLCFEGVLQADALVGSESRGVMLDPAVQARLVQEWLQRVTDPETLHIPSDLDEAYFRARSEGECVMSSKPAYELHSTTPGALEKMRGHSEPYEVTVAGMPILVLPNVWSPKYDWSSTFYIENFPNVEGLSFLEIGSGTGVICVYAGRHGASRVVAVDANPDAVRNTRLNFERHELGRAEVILSEGFDRVRGRFDIVTWNAPYHGNRPADALERGCSDENYRGIRAFFHDVNNHLTPGGTVIFGFSESGDLPLIRSLIKEAGYSVKRELSDWRQDYNCMLFELVQMQHRPASH